MQLIAMRESKKVQESKGSAKAHRGTKVQFNQLGSSRDGTSVLGKSGLSDTHTLAWGSVER